MQAAPLEVMKSFVLQVILVKTPFLQVISILLCDFDNNDNIDGVCLQCRFSFFKNFKQLPKTNVSR